MRTRRRAIAPIGDEPRLAYNRVLLSSVLVRSRTGGYLANQPPQ
jgi:NAD(P)H-nitrite reductase large subunit